MPSYTIHPGQPLSLGAVLKLTRDVDDFSASHSHSLAPLPPAEITSVALSASLAVRCVAVPSRPHQPPPSACIRTLKRAPRMAWNRTLRANSRSRFQYDVLAK